MFRIDSGGVSECGLLTGILYCALETQIAPGYLYLTFDILYSGAIAKLHCQAQIA